MEARSQRGIMVFALVAIVSWFGVANAGEERARAGNPRSQGVVGANHSPKWTDVVAEVNGEPITRGQLAEELVETYGLKQLDLLINRKVIEHACRDRKIEISRAELEKEFNDSLKRFNVTRREFITTILSRREMTMAQYMRDTVWPAVALKKLVEADVKVTELDVKKAFEANYGEKMDVRMLVVRELRRAQELWEEISQKKDPQERQLFFEDCCKTYSVDAATRSFGGQTQPIHRHSNWKPIEDLAFGLQPGELSKIIQVPDGNLMLLCVARIPARQDVTLETIIDEKTNTTVRDLLSRDVHEKLTKVAIATYYESIRGKAVVNDYLTGNFDPESVEQVSHTAPAPVENVKKPADK